MKRIGPVPPNRLSNTKQQISPKEIGGECVSLISRLIGNLKFHMDGNGVYQDLAD
jgi:hypothetical protein